MYKIWCVEDDSAINELYACVFESYGFEYRIFESGESFFESLKEEIPDLVLLDVMLPGEDGFEIISKIKSNPILSGLAVIFVSAKGDELSRVKGLNLGADDYIQKPFSVLELVARINANLRIRKTDIKEIKYKDIEIDTEKHQVKINGEIQELPRKEYSLLLYLTKNATKTMIREQIFKEVWGEEFMGETRTLDMHIKALRNRLKKVEITTVRGVGFRLE